MWLITTDYFKTGRKCGLFFLRKYEMMPFIKFARYMIPSYWLMCMLGLVASSVLLYARRKRFHFASDDTLHILLLGVIGAMIGAKALYLITIAPELLRHASEIDWSYRTIELLFSGGYVFYGGLIGGFLAAAVYCCRYRISLRAAADFYAPALPLFHVFGRIGCFPVSYTHLTLPTNREV